MGPYRIAVTPADVGARVTLRSRLRTGHEGGPGLTDTVGRLRAFEDGTLVVERRDGTTATVAAADLVAAKVLPPSPPPRDQRRTRHLQKGSP